MLVVPCKQFIMFKPFPPSPRTYPLPLWKTQLSRGLCSGLGLSVEGGRRRLRKPSAPMGALEAALPFSLSPLLLVLIHSFVRLFIHWVVHHSCIPPLVHPPSHQPLGTH